MQRMLASIGHDATRRRLGSSQSIVDEALLALLRRAVLGLWWPYRLQRFSNVAFKTFTSLFLGRGIGSAIRGELVEAFR